jgi:hypothetical protein
VFDPVTSDKASDLEEVCEQGHDPANVGAEELQGRKDGFPFQRFSLAHRYAEREICLHVHVLARLGNKPEPTYYCAVYEGANSAIAGNDLATSGTPAGSFNRGVNEAEAAVFVDDVELVDGPEGVGFHRSVVRLKLLHQCEGFWRDAGKIFWVSGIPRSRLIEDWEAALLRHKRLTVDEGVSGLIEGGAEGVDALSDQTRPFLIGRMLNDLGSPEEVVLPLPKVVLSEHSVRVSLDELAELKAQLAEVFFCSLELHPSAAKRVSHGENHDSRPLFRQTLLGGFGVSIGETA